MASSSNDPMETNSPVDDDDDPVIAELPIVIMPTKDGDTINRVQFPNQETAKMLNCAVQFKQNVGHLKIESFKGISPAMINGFGFDAAGPSTSNTLRGDSDVYYGEGFADHEVLDYAFGFIKDGKLCLLPVERSFEMRRLMKPKPTEGKMFESGKAQPKPELAPVRMKFERAETDEQKKHRERSAFHKQKLIEQDPWIPLEVQRTDTKEMYEGAVLDVETDRMAEVRVSLSSLL